MALQASGSISMSQIRAELGIPSQAPFSLDSAENGSYVTLNANSPLKPSSANPASISEWYGYCHSCTAATYYRASSGGVNGYSSTGAACTARSTNSDYALTIYLVSTVAVGNYFYSNSGIVFDSAPDKYYYIGSSINKIFTVSSTYTYLNGWYIYQFSSVSDCPTTYGVDFYGRYGQSTGLTFDLYYILNNNNATLTYWGTASSTTCGNLNSINVYDGTVVTVYAYYSGTQIYLRGSSGDCPANLDIDCSYSATVTAFTNIYITVYVDGSGNPRYCN